MKVGIKYCGGCNPRYDRGEFVSKLLAAHPDWDAESLLARYRKESEDFRQRKAPYERYPRG